MTGQVAILNVAAGDTKLSFDPKNPDEAARAARIVKDMIRRGFVLLIEVGRDDKGPMYRRALDFDETTSEYIIAGTGQEEMETVTHDEKPASAPKRKRKTATRSDKGGTHRVPARRTSAVAVARTAGG